MLILVLSVVNGFERELRERVLSLLPHVTAVGARPITYEDLAELRSLSRTPAGVLGVAGFVQGTVLLSANAKIKGASLTGVDPVDYRQVSEIERYLTKPGLNVLAAERFSLILGERLAGELGIAVGDEVLVVLPAGALTPVGAIPRQRRFKVVDLLRSESQLDSQAAFTLLADAQRFFRTGNGVHGFQLRAADLFELDSGVTYLQDLLADYQVRITTWMRNYGNLYQAIAVQKLTMFVLLSFLVGVAAFNLVSGLMMIVEQRRHDIAVLRTLGAGSTTIVLVFALLGTLLAALGIAGGLALGGFIAVMLPKVYAWASVHLSLNLMSQYFIAYLPTDPRVSDFVNVGVASLVLALCAVIYPAVRASKLLPSRVLAHE